MLSPPDFQVVHGLIKVIHDSRLHPVHVQEPEEEARSRAEVAALAQLDVVHPSITASPWKK